MTREEAIKYLNEFILFKKISNTTEGEAVECFKLAVEALQEHQHYKDLAENYEKTINKLTKAIREQQGERTKERTETHACDYISRKAVLEGLTSIAKAKAKSDAQKSLMGRVMFFTEHLPSATPQPKTESARGDIPLQQSVPEMPQPKTEQESFEDCIRKSVIVHPKKGHWIGDKGTTVYVNSEGNVTESVNCSECGEWLTGSDEYICGARYCPSCGLKMEEVEE